METILRGSITPIRNRNNHISKGIANIIDKSLSNTPKDRYQDAGEMKKALEKVI
jgi:serine/threonine protein kinase